MQLQIIAANVQLSPLMREFIRKRAQMALNRYRHHIDWVLLRLEDLNGPRGALDKRCEVSARLLGLGTLFAQGTDRDWLPAAGRATERVARRIERDLGIRHQEQVSGQSPLD